MVETHGKSGFAIGLYTLPCGEGHELKAVCKRGCAWEPITEVCGVHKPDDNASVPQPLLGMQMHFFFPFQKITASVNVWVSFWKGRQERIISH